MRTRSISLLAGGLASTVLAMTTATSSVFATDDVIVASGDTLSGIALAHGLTTAELAAINRIDNPNRIYVGQHLALEPAAAASAPVATAAAPTAAPAAGSRVHVVVAGEHLTRIARRYGTTVHALAAANGITNPSFIRAGDRLTIPGQPDTTAAPAAAPATQPAVATTTHVVASGENLTWIARRYGTTVAAIVRANGMANPSLVRTGTHLTIPGASTPSLPAAQSASAPAPPMPASMAVLVAARAEVGASIEAAAARHGVPVAFAQAVAWQESGWQQDMTSRVGAVGVMQLMPDTVDWVASAMLHRPVDEQSRYQNIDAGVRLLRHYWDRYHGDRARILAAYYQGQRSVEEHGIYAVSRPYIASITALERIFSR